MVLGCVVSDACAGRRNRISTNLQEAVIQFDITHVIAESEIAEHQGMVPVELSADGTRLFTAFVPQGQKRKKIFIYDTASGEQLAELSTGMEACTALRIAPDASGVVMEGSSHKYVSTDGERSAKVRKTGDASCFSTDGETVFTSDGKSLYRWSVEEQSKLGSSKHGRSEIEEIRRTEETLVAARIDSSFNSERQAFDYDGEFVEIDESTGDVEVLEGLPSITRAAYWDVHGDRIAIRHQGDYVLRAYSLDGGEVASIDTPDTPEFRSGRALRFADENTVVTLDLTGGEPNEVYTQQRRLRLWNLDDNTVEDRPLEHPVATNSTGLAVAGNTIVIGDTEDGILIGEYTRS